MSGHYVPLWCKSTFSFLEGASHPDELVEEAYRLGLRSLALTDRDGVHGMVRAHVKAREVGLHLIVGSEVTVGDGSTLILLAQDRGGYANLCRLISKGRLRCPKGESRVGWDEVCAHAEGMVALWGGTGSRILEEAPVPAPTDAEGVSPGKHPGVSPGKPVGRTQPIAPTSLLEPMTDLDTIAGNLRDAFGDRLHALLTRHRAPDDARSERRLRERARHFGMRTVAGMEVLYHSPARRDLQDVLTCIRHRVTLATAGRLLEPNAEHALRAPHGFGMLYADDPPSVYRTVEVGERCTFSFSDIRYRYPAERLPDGTSSHEWLRHLTFEGARERYRGDIPDDVRQQVEKELALIEELDYDGYFLTMWEIVRYCGEHGILCQGRGSAANSAVCYCLGITAVDPVRMGLLFERFLSRERAEPPDIDLDIEHDRREEVIQHVYQKYGRTHAAMVANVVRYRARSAVREVGKVLGMPETAVDRFAKMLSHYDSPTADALVEAGFDPGSRMHQDLLRMTMEIQDVPRHLSIHPGGFLLGHEPVHDIVPIENATMPDRTVIQWDKDDLEDLGLFKVDLLGLGALNVVHRSFDLIEAHRGEQWTMATIPPQDEPTFEMIQAADTVGTFQIESRAQMAMLPRLKPRNYYDLVIEVSIVRPGPITGGMVHPFLRRRNGEEEVDYAHPSLEPILKKTLGVPIFQEQVMQLAMVAADYAPGEADQLRRDMAAWRRSGRIERHRERIVSRMIHKGISREFAERVFDQIRGFGEYGFPESHAASFALIGYATAWLKRHYPAAYVCALLNAQPMGFYSPATLVEDSKRHGVVFRPVDVRVSDWECGLERCPDSGEGFAVRMGFRYVKGLSEGEWERIASARQAHPFRSLDDFATRTGLDSGMLTRLAETGAFEGFATERRDALWTVRGVDRVREPALALDAVEGSTAFTPLSPFETISWDYSVTDHSPRGHPLTPLREEIASQGLPDAAAVRSMGDGARVRYAGLVITRQRPGTAGGVVFMTLEDETGFVNVVLWERVYKEHRVLVKSVSFIGVTGKLQVESGVVHLVADELWVPEISLKPQKTRSRNFH